MSPTHFNITPEISEGCRLLQELAQRLITFFANLPPRYGQYESTAEAYSLLRLSTRNVQGVIALARTDLVLLPSAHVVARAAFESAVKAAWMIDAEDPFDREARYLAHLASEEKYLQWEGKRFTKVGISSELGKTREEGIRNFRLEMTAKLPPRIKVVGLPNLDQMLTSIGGDKLYAFYNKMSQYTHANHAATWLYRSGGLGTDRKQGEFIQPNQWFIPLRVCLLALGQPGRICIQRLGGDEYGYYSMEQEEIIESALSKVGIENLRLH